MTFSVIAAALDGGRDYEIYVDRRVRHGGEVVAALAPAPGRC